jgi:hypothetical protein
MLISAEFQIVTDYTITIGKTLKWPHSTLICILFSSTRLNILLKQVGNSFSVLIGYGLGHWSLIFALIQCSLLIVYFYIGHQILLTGSMPQPVSLQTCKMSENKTKFIIPSFKCVEPCLHFRIWLNVLMHRDDNVVPLLVCLTSGINTFSSMCRIKCINNCIIRDPGAWVATGHVGGWQIAVDLSLWQACLWIKIGDRGPTPQPQGVMCGLP